MGLIYEELTGELYGAAIEVHRELGLGLLEAAYEKCLCRELQLRELSFATQVSLPVEYKGIKLECGYRMDIVVDEKVIIEIKSVETTLPVHEAQLLTYLKLSKMKVGLLMNFNVPMMKDGILRRVL